jgi:hypothetical protein
LTADTKPAGGEKLSSEKNKRPFERSKGRLLFLEKSAGIYSGKSFVDR